MSTYCISIHTASRQFAWKFNDLSNVMGYWNKLGSERIDPHSKEPITGASLFFDNRHVSTLPESTEVNEGSV